MDFGVDGGGAHAAEVTVLLAGGKLSFEIGPGFKTAQEKVELLRAFEEIYSRDEKTHLHVVESATCRFSSLEHPRPF